MTIQPLVNVLMPVYNGEKYLREAIDSILSQSFTDFEFLIINDGSTDSTEEIIFSYDDSRIRYVKNEINLRLIATLNKGIDLCSGKYIARMDADDISTPERLEKQFDFMEKNQDVGICGTWYDSFNEMGNVGSCRYLSSHDEISLKHLYQIHLSHGTAMIRKSILDAHQFRFDSEFAHAEDYDLFTRMAMKTRLANLPFVGYLVRQHENEVSVKFNNVQKENSLKVRKRLFKILHNDADDKDLLAYESLNHQNYKTVNIDADRVKFLLESLYLGNTEERFIEDSLFQNHMKNIWLHYCYHTTSINYYLSSSLLSDKKKLKEVSQLKWRIKSLF